MVADPGTVPINSRGEKQRMHLRDGFLADQLDPIYVAYNMWSNSSSFNCTVIAETQKTKRKPVSNGSTLLSKQAFELVPSIVNRVLEEDQLIVGIVVIADPGTVLINSRGEKQQMHLRDGFLADQLDPIYVAYKCSAAVWGKLKLNCISELKGQAWKVTTKNAQWRNNYLKVWTDILSQGFIRQSKYWDYNIEMIIT